MLPEIAQLEFHVDTQEEQVELGKSFLFIFNKDNFEKEDYAKWGFKEEEIEEKVKEGDFLLKDGRLIRVDGMEALKIWIIKVLKTEKSKYKIYDDTDYGAGLEDLMGQTLPIDFVESELKREIKSALEKHPRIKSISNLQTTRDGARVIVEFTVNLVEGNTFNQEVIF
ncbi:hypothetical protein HNQ80_003623 [Anaerosolibacter carboniphilus]|uniref:DUF2634 domain-containing protein n=1 Tax=Anaerosolibacter carboniphilus TaxID=1417629 RepID=A0A841L2Y0_9FIRM|nr:DUF2634 domain-containing protein [Anaerosolibacter carboniphilus]MBB6217502.1 hypothetical protein [Anaerosolibacter carboniphilus]